MSSSTSEARHPNRDGPFQQLSITVPTDVLSQVRARVGPRGVSAFLTRAAQRELHRDALGQWLAQMDEEHGPVSAELEAQVHRTWLDPAARR